MLGKGKHDTVKDMKGRAHTGRIGILLIFLILILPLSEAFSPEAPRDMREKGAGKDEPGVIYQSDLNINKPNRIAVMKVGNFGTIRIELYDNMTPITTQNFAGLAESGFYDGLKFHRTIDDFVAQTGDPNTRDTNPYNDGQGGSGETIPLEIHPNATHVDGAVGMARETEPDTASSQFYVCDGPQHQLDDDNRMKENGQHGYAVFGVVIEGLDVAKRIAAVETYGKKRPLLKDHPVDDIVIESVTILPGQYDNGTEDAAEEPEENDIARISEVASGPWGILVAVDIVVFVGLLLWMVVFRRKE